VTAHTHTLTAPRLVGSKFGGWTMRRLSAIILCVLLLALAAVGDWGPGNISRSADAAKAGGSSNIDERATRLRVKLGSFCRNFDFFYRHSFASGKMRPVRCSRANAERTVVLVYAFSDRDTRDAWLDEWGRIAKQRNAPVIKGRRWAAEVLVRKHAKRIRRRLTH
jgi:hypothetical protein